MNIIYFYYIPYRKFVILCRNNLSIYIYKCNVEKNMLERQLKVSKLIAVV